jgi:nucleoside diphosphate kinase
MKTHCDIKNATLCIIKPHILTDNLSGKIVDDIINSGFKIIAAEMFPLTY